MTRAIEITSWLGFIQGILLVVLLLTRKNNPLANRFLGCYILLISLDCLEPVVQQLPDNLLKKTWEFIWGGLVFLHGPLLFSYVRAMERTRPINFKHLLLPLPYYVMIIPFLILDESTPGLDAYAIVLHELFFLHLIIYSAMSWHQLNEHQKQISSGATQPENLRWLKTLTGLALFLYVSAFITVQLSIITGNALIPLQLSIQMILVLVMYVTSYKSIVQPQLFVDFSTPKQGIRPEKYQNSSLTEEKARDIERSLLDYMKEKRIYLDPNLTLDMLADAIHESRYHVSQVINEKLKLNFNDFVNAYRVEEFKRLAIKPSRRRQTVLELSRQAGFTSKTSFHNVFKKMTGQTPTQYCSQAKQSDTLSQASA